MPGAGRCRGRGGASGGPAELAAGARPGWCSGSPFPGPLPALPPASRSVNWLGQAGSDTAALAQPPPPPPPRAQTSPGPAKVGAVPNRRLGSVRGVPVSSPPGRRPRLSSPGTGRSSSEARDELRRRLLGLIEGNRVMIFSKSYCPHSTRVGGAGPGGAGVGAGTLLGQWEPGGGEVFRSPGSYPSRAPGARVPPVQPSDSNREATRVFGGRDSGPGTRGDGDTQRGPGPVAWPRWHRWRGGHAATS